MIWGKFNLKELEELNPKPSAKKFAVFINIVLLVLLFLYPSQILVALLGLGVLLGLFFRGLLEPLNTLWYRLGLILGYVLSPLVLGAFYFLFFAPIALVLKAFGHKSFRAGWVERKSKLCDFKKSF